MYRNDNTMPSSGCSETILHMMLDGGNHDGAKKIDNSCCGQIDNGRSTWGLNGYPLAMAYAPLQNFEGLYDLDKALERGTIFSALDLPFEGRSISKGGKCNG